MKKQLVKQHDLNKLNQLLRQLIFNFQKLFHRVAKKTKRKIIKRKVKNWISLQKCRICTKKNLKVNKLNANSIYQKLKTKIN